MTKTITCAKCNGRGYFTIEQFGADYASVNALRCEVCKGKGAVEVPVTNADHIRSMTDEELAEFMFTMLGCVSCQNKLMRGKCTEEYFEMCIGSGQKCKEFYLKWLKQPHKEAT